MIIDSIDSLIEKWCDENYTEEYANELIYQYIESFLYGYNGYPTDYQNPKDLFDWAIENVENFDENYAQIVELYEPPYSSLNSDMKNETMLEDKAYDELSAIYEVGCDEIYTTLYRQLDKLQERLPNFDISYEQERSHSWAAGRFVSEYFSYRVENYDRDICEESKTIRICDGHDNGMQHEYQINVMNYIDVENGDFTINGLDKKILNIFKDTLIDIDISDFTDEEQQIWDIWINQI